MSLVNFYRKTKMLSKLAKNLHIDRCRNNWWFHLPCLALIEMMLSYYMWHRQAGEISRFATLHAFVLKVKARSSVLWRRTEAFDIIWTMNHMTFMHWISFLKLQLPVYLILYRTVAIITSSYKSAICNSMKLLLCFPNTQIHFQELSCKRIFLSYCPRLSYPYNPKLTSCLERRA